jgi:hypothetical protein
MSRRAATEQFDQEDATPGFLWDRKVTVGRLRAALLDPGDPQHVQLLRVLLREARPDEVWKFVTPEQVAREWASIRPGLGRRRAFWEWLLAEWRDRGLLP